MKILIISFVDDNFGDNLIRICFEELLKVALLNCGFLEKDYSISKMNLKSINEESIVNSDIVFFAGGGLFGLSYLNFYDYLNEIMEIAEKNSIPVIFSSIGINNMDVNSENEKILTDFFRYSCIKAVSVRDNLELFRKYTKRCSFEVEEVCDPAVWTRYVYNINHISNRENKIIGINVVRGGLFNDNGRAWKLGDELKFLKQLSEELEKREIDYRFYTNGSILDNNALHYFVREHSIDEKNCVFPNTTREVVETINNFDAVVAFRMHSSIIAYSFLIPSISFVWNDKIPFFYKSIGCLDRAINFEKWNVGYAIRKLEKIIEEKYELQHENKYQEYLMTVYNYLFRVLSYFSKKNTKNFNNKFDFETVTACLKSNTLNIYEDISDMQCKLEKAEKQYLERFVDLKERDRKIKLLNKEKNELETELNKRKKENEKLSGNNASLKEQIKQEREESGKVIEKLKKENEILQKKFSVRVINYLKKVMKR